MAEAPNAVRELAEDATSRKRFLRQAGGTGVAASLAAFIAACGGDSSQSRQRRPRPPTPTMARKSGTEQFGQGDLGIANYALTLEYLETDFYAKVANSGMLKGKLARPRQALRQRGAGARRRADRADQEGGRQAGRGAEDELPARQREVDPEARGDRREPRRPRLPRPGRAHPGQGDPGRRPVDPLGRGAPRGGPQPRHGAKPAPDGRSPSRRRPTRS